jgi:heme-degrading monooxygenase HmoA
MILEVVDIRIKPGQQQPFEEDLARGVRDVIAHAQGFISHTLHHGIESPERYLLQIVWNTLEDHTVGFRQSDAFTKWRSIVGPYFAEPPKVEHFNLL